jgi:glycosyltransferase involved in cell wall biosynthesis
MNIGIDGLLLRGREAGSLRYFRQLLEGLAEAGSGHTFHIYALQPFLRAVALPVQANFHYHPIRSSGQAPAALQQQLYFARRPRQPLDLLHSPVFVPPLVQRGPTVMTVFDLTFRLHPETQKWTGRFWWRLLGPAGMRKADRLIAISENTRQELCQHLKLPEQKIRLVYPYVPAGFQPVRPAREVLERYGLPGKYILTVGTLERRKNLAITLRAYARARQGGAAAYSLVFVGVKGWKYADIFKTLAELGLEDHVFFLGHVPDADLPALYSGAGMLVFLSQYEGFGYPPLEAFACGTPVLAARSSSLPEVVGEAGLLVPPEDVDAAADGMSRLLNERALAEELVGRGLARARLFSKERFIQATLAVYAEALMGR